MNFAGSSERRVAAQVGGYGCVRWTRARGRVLTRNGERTDVG